MAVRHRKLPKRATQLDSSTAAKAKDELNKDLVSSRRNTKFILLSSIGVGEASSLGTLCCLVHSYGFTRSPFSSLAFVFPPAFFSILLFFHPKLLPPPTPPPPPLLQPSSLLPSSITSSLACLRMIDTSPSSQSWRGRCHFGLRWLLQPPLLKLVAFVHSIKSPLLSPPPISFPPPFRSSLPFPSFLLLPSLPLSPSPPSPPPPPLPFPSPPPPTGPLLLLLQDYSLRPHLSRGRGPDHH